MKLLEPRLNLSRLHFDFSPSLYLFQSLHASSIEMVISWNREGDKKNPPNETKEANNNNNNKKKKKKMYFL